MNIPAIIGKIQGKLGLEADGVAGPQTWPAIYKAIFGEDYKESSLPEAIAGSIDERSENNIRTLLPRVQPYARALIIQCAKQGIRIVITSGSRTYEEQDELYRQGRDKPGVKVTNAKGGQSNHNFGIAFDVTIFDGAKPVWESPVYKAVGAIGKGLGLAWGGDWKGISDEPHFELKPVWAADFSESAMVAALRDRKGRGVDIFA